MSTDFNTQYPPTWCPGCGNLGIWAALKAAFNQLNWTPDKFAVVYDIGCSGNMNDFLKSYGFHGLHGRAIPAAVGIHLANHKLPVLAILGDGGAYGEGGNHLMHAMRANFNIKIFVHDNRVYGLTTGQSTPTSPQGYQSKSTPFGLIETPLNPLALSIIQGATFVAQGFAGDIPQLTQIIHASIQHHGFSIVNILQPCFTFNQVNTYQYFRDNTYHLDKPFIQKQDALKEVIDNSKLPVGVIYQTTKPTFTDQLPQLKNGTLMDESPPSFNFDELLTDFA